MNNWAAPSGRKCVEGIDKALTLGTDLCIGFAVSCQLVC